MRFLLTATLAVLFSTFGAGAPATAQDAYPSRAVTLLIPFAAGGSSDVVARIVGEEVSRVLGQPLIFENVTGAGGSIGLTRAAAAKPDGYTIAIGNTGTNAAAYAIYPDLKYKPSDFRALGLVARTASLVAIRPSLPAKSVAEFVALAKKEPGNLKLGHAGVGSSNYVICQAFIKATGIDVSLIGYRGAAPALTDVLGGHIDGVCDAASSLIGSLADNKVHGLVIGGSAKLAAMPAIPNAAEAGIPTFQAGGWNAFFAPKDTPAPVVAKLNEAIRKALGSEFVTKRFADLSTTVPGADEATADAVDSLITKEIEKYKSILTPVR